MNDLYQSFLQENLNRSQADAFVWTTGRFADFYAQQRRAQSKRSAERFLVQHRWLPPQLQIDTIVDEHHRPIKRLVARSWQETAAKKRWVSLYLQLHNSPVGKLLVANDARHSRYWIVLSTPLNDHKQKLLTWLRSFANTASASPILFWPSGNLCHYCRGLTDSEMNGYQLAMSAYQPSTSFTLA